MTRKIIIVAISALILLGSYLISGALKDSKKDPPKKKGVKTAVVFTQIIQNGVVPIEVTATGRLLAKNRIELYSEVQGVMTSPAGSFKAGTSYNAGATLVKIDSDVYSAGLMSQKSNLQNLVTAALADIRLDYPASFDKWNNFLSKIEVNKALPALPEPSSDKEKMFLTGRNVYSTYYNVRNMELTLAKYNITAPFNGVLVEALVTPGSLIRPGQKLGAFIQPTVYELETPVSSSMIGYLEVGQTVDLYSTSDANQKWEGKIARINNLIDAATQTTNIYIDVQGEGLKEGMFLKTNIMAIEIDDAVELDRSVLFDTDKIFVVKDSILVEKEIEPVYYNDKTVVVRGLDNGEEALAKLPTGAYSGMKVNIYQDN